MDAVFGVFFVFPFGFQDELLEDVIVARDDTEKELECQYHTKDLCSVKPRSAEMQTIYLILRADPWP